MTEGRFLTQRCHQCGKPVSEQTGIIISEEKGWVFDTEVCLHQHFSSQIESIAKDLESHRKADDIPMEKFGEYEEMLDELLEEPAEIWEDTETFPDYTIQHFIGEFGEEGKPDVVYYVATVFMTGEAPSFVFVHFPTKDINLVEHFRRGRLIFDRSSAEIEVEASEDDALSEGDELATGLFKAMLNLRSANDIPEKDFPEYQQHRQQAIEDADEMWRSTDLQGNSIVTFIRDFAEGESEFTYIVITVEDVVSGSHFILFSFPTRDQGLVDRYRQGQNLHEDALNRQESH